MTSAYVSACPTRGGIIVLQGWPSVLSVVLGFAEALPDDLQGFLVRALPCRYRVGEPGAGESLVLRSGEQFGDRDDPGHRIRCQQAEIKQRVDVSPQQQPVGDVI